MPFPTSPMPGKTTEVYYSHLIYWGSSIEIKSRIDPPAFCILHSILMQWDWSPFFRDAILKCCNGLISWTRARSPDVEVKKWFRGGVKKTFFLLSVKNWDPLPPQWAKSGGEAVLLQFSDFTKDPMHDFNRLFCWNSCDCEFWPYIMYLLVHIHEKAHASDDKSLKMNHATFALDSAATTPSSGKKN